MSTGTIRHTHRMNDKGLFSLNFHPNEGWVAIGKAERLAFLFVDTWEVRLGPDLRLGYPRCALAGDGRLLVAIEAIREVSAIQAWHLGPGHLVEPAWLQGPHTFVGYDNPAISQDGRTVAVSTLGAEDHSWQSIQVRTGETGDLELTMDYDAGEPIQQLAFTTDGALLLVRSYSRTVKAFDPATGRAVGELVHPRRSYVTGLAVHPGGKAIATCRNDGTVWLWEPATLQPIRTFDWKLGKLVSVAFSPDGLLAAAGTEDGQVVVWDLDW